MKSLGADVTTVTEGCFEFIVERILGNHEKMTPMETEDGCREHRCHE